MSLLNIPLTHLLIFHLSGALLRCELGLSQIFTYYFFFWTFERRETKEDDDREEEEEDQALFSLFFCIFLFETKTGVVVVSKSNEKKMSNCSPAISFRYL